MSQIYRFASILLSFLLLATKCASIPLNTSQISESAGRSVFYGAQLPDSSSSDGALLFTNGSTFKPPACRTDEQCIDLGASLCLDGACACSINYRFTLRPNSQEIICSPFKCDNDGQCGKWDANLVCSLEGMCICRREFFTAPTETGNGSRCIPMTGGSLSWLLYLTVIPILLLIVFCVYICIRLGQSPGSFREKAVNLKRRMSRKLSAFTGISLASNEGNTGANGNGNGEPKKGKNQLPRSISESEIE